MYTASLLTLIHCFTGCIGMDGAEQTSANDDDVIFGERSVEYRGEQLKAADMHLHTGDWDGLPPHMQEIFRQTLPFPFNQFPREYINFNLSSIGIAGQLLDARLSHGVLMAVYAPGTVGLTTNDFVRQRIAQIPGRFYGMASLSVADWEQTKEESLQNLADHLSLPEFIGVKLAHPHMGIALNDSAYYPIYEVAAQFDAPVYVHTGNTPAPGSRTDPPAIDPSYLEEAISLHPDTTFILGHMGYDFLGKTLGNVETCIALAAKYPNVYLEASALGSAGSDPEGVNLPEVFRLAKEAGVVERMIYGSDGPQRPGFVKDYLSRTMAAMDANGYTVEEAQRVLYGTFAEIYDVE